MQVWPVSDGEIVRLPTRRLRDDAELRGRALRALALNVAVPRTIDVLVDSGVVMLTGIVDSRFEREEAGRAVRARLGIAHVDNRILVRASA